MWSVLLFTPDARAVDLALGAAVAVQIDLPDASGGAGLGPGPTCVIPLILGVGPSAAIRIGPSLSLAWGDGRVSWLDAAGVRYVEPEAQLVMAGVGLSAGPEVHVPVPAVDPYFGATLGVSWVGTWYGLEGAAAEGVVPPGATRGPHAASLAPTGEVLVGVRPRILDGVALQIESGYSVAFLGARGLTGAADGVEARREAVGINTFRLGLGVLVSL